jgi:hypothetical protein
MFGHIIVKQDCQDRAGRTGQPVGHIEQTARKGQTGQESQGRAASIGMSVKTARTGHPKRERRDGRGRTGKTEEDNQDKTARAKQPGQYCQDRTAKKKEPEQDSLDRTPEKNSHDT